MSDKERKIALIVQTYIDPHGSRPTYSQEELKRILTKYTDVNENRMNIFHLGIDKKTIEALITRFNTATPVSRIARLRNMLNNVKPIPHLMKNKVLAKSRKLLEMLRKYPARGTQQILQDSIVIFNLQAKMSFMKNAVVTVMEKEFFMNVGVIVGHLLSLSFSTAILHLYDDPLLQKQLVTIGAVVMDTLDPEQVGIPDSPLMVIFFCLCALPFLFKDTFADIIIAIVSQGKPYAVANITELNLMVRHIQQLMRTR